MTQPFAHSKKNLDNVFAIVLQWFYTDDSTSSTETFVSMSMIANILTIIFHES